MERVGNGRDRGEEAQGRIRREGKRSGGEGEKERRAPPKVWFTAQYSKS